MADRIPIKLHAGIQGLAEFQEGDTVPLNQGGTGAITPEQARNNLELGTIALVNDFDAQRDPDINDDVTIGATHGSRWFNHFTDPDRLYICTDPNIGVARWVQLGLGDEPIQDIEFLTVTTIDIRQTASFIQEFNYGFSGAVNTIDWLLGNKQSIDLTQNTEFIFVNPPGPCNVLLRLYQTIDGDFTPNWPGNVKWPSGQVPITTFKAPQFDHHGHPIPLPLQYALTAPNPLTEPSLQLVLKEDIISFYFNGESFYGAYLQDFS